MITIQLEHRAARYFIADRLKAKAEENKLDLLHEKKQAIQGRLSSVRQGKYIQ